MIARLPGGKIEVRSRRHSDFRPNDDLSDLEALVRAQRIEQWPVQAINADGRRLRKHSTTKKQELRRAIANFRILVPIVVDPTGKILAGRARWEIAIELGLREVPVIVVSHLSGSEKRLYAIADNRLQELAAWDMDELKVELKEVHIADPELDLNLSGFETPDIDRIFGLTDGVTDEDDSVVHLKDRAISHEGDLWLLGCHKVYCGSALENASYNTIMERERAQMVVTDPPYNVSINGHVRTAGTAHREFVAASGEMSEQQFTEFLRRFLKCMREVSEDGAIVYIFMDHAHSLELQAAAYPLFGKQKALCVWAKDAAGMGSFYRSQHELVFVYKNGTARHINNFNLGEKGRYRTNVWRYPGANTGHDRRDALEMHPTVKPAAMFVDAMLDCSHRGGIVLDCFGGSGVTLIAAERTQRVARVIELDPLYVDLMIRRWQSFTGRTAIHAATGMTFAEREIRLKETE